jgi:PAS domain S-box-containing protein
VNENNMWLTTLLKSIGDAVITADDRGIIQSMNGAAEALTGWTQQEAVGRPISQVLKLRDVKTLLPIENQISRVLGGCSPVVESNNLLLVSRDGNAMPIEARVATMADMAGKSTAVSLTFRGIAEPRPTIEALEEVFAKVQQAKREWESTVDSIADLILLVDNLGQIIRANRTVETWNLGCVEEVSSRPVHVVLHPSCVDTNCYLALLVKKLVGQTTDGQSVEQEIYDRILDRYLLIKARPVHDPRHQVTQATVIILQDITERKQAEETLRRYAAELEARTQELDAFAHTVAHDLKNPVGLVIGYAEFLRKDAVVASVKNLTEAMQALARAGHKMNSIIEELLLLAEIRKEQVVTMPLDMGHIVDEAQQRLTQMIAESGAEIVLPSAWPVASGYAPWIEEVWVNYLSNAIKYGGRPPRVELGAVEQPDGQVRFWVSDNGRGLSPEQRARLFVPFTRLEQIRAQGHGLGLSIVRRIMEKLGGQAGVESPGSIFYFTLPATAEVDATIRQKDSPCTRV